MEEWKIESCDDCPFITRGTGFGFYSCLHPLVLRREWFVSIGTTGAHPHESPPAPRKGPTDDYKGCPLKEHPVLIKKVA
jgi:hypothetical protein